MRANDCPGWAKFSHRWRCVAQGGEGHEGIYSKTLSEVFRLLEERSEDYEFSASVSMLEIYNEAIYDLLSDSSSTQLHAAAMGGGPQKIRIRATGGGKNVISDLSSVEVTSADGAMECVSIGKQNRATACTDSNAHSSRSHCILSFHLRATNVHEGIVTESRLRMIDLAGSERLDRSGGECSNGWFGLTVAATLTVDRCCEQRRASGWRRPRASTSRCPLWATSSRRSSRSTRTCRTATPS